MNMMRKSFNFAMMRCIIPSCYQLFFFIQPVIRVINFMQTGINVLKNMKFTTISEIQSKPDKATIHTDKFPDKPKINNLRAFFSYSL